MLGRRQLAIVFLLSSLTAFAQVGTPVRVVQIGTDTISLYDTLFNATSATATQTSSAVRIPGFSGYGSFSVVFASLTGSPVGCQFAFEYQQNTGTAASAAFFTQSVTPSTSYQSFTVSPSAGFNAGDKVVVVYSCGTYPTAGTMTLTYNPTGQGPLPAGTNVIGHVVADTGSTTAVTALPAIPSGSNVIGHVIADTGSTTAVTALPAIPTGSNVIGHVIADTGSTTAVTALPATPTGSNVIGKVGIDQTTPGTTNAVQATNFPATVDTNSGNKSASTPRVVLATDQPNLTTPLNTQGSLSDNTAAPSTNNLGAMPCMARTDLRAGTAATAGRLIYPDCGTDGLQHVAALPDLSMKRYRASSKFAASSTTDNWRISGNASNTVIVTKLSVTCTETTAAQVSVQLIKRSTAGSGGTAASVAAVPLDSNKAAASSVVNSYTGTGPTVGTPVGNIDDAQFGCMAAGTATPNDIYIPATSPGAPIAVLRGVAEGIALNFGGALTGGNLTVSVEWEEVTTVTP